MDDSTVAVCLLLFCIGFIAWCVFCASLLALVRLLSRTVRACGHATHAAWEWAVCWVLYLAPMAGPLDGDPESYAPRAAVLPPHHHHAKPGRAS